MATMHRMRPSGTGAQRGRSSTPTHDFQRRQEAQSAKIKHAMMYKSDADVASASQRGHHYQAPHMKLHRSSTSRVVHATMSQPQTPGERDNSMPEAARLRTEPRATTATRSSPASRHASSAAAATTAPPPAAAPLPFSFGSTGAPAEVLDGASERHGRWIDPPGPETPPAEASWDFSDAEALLAPAAPQPPPPRVEAPRPASSAARAWGGWRDVRTDDELMAADAEDARSASWGWAAQRDAPRAAQATVQSFVETYPPPRSAADLRIAPPPLPEPHVREAICSHTRMPRTPELQPGWDAVAGAQAPRHAEVFPAEVWDKPEKPPYVHVVASAAEAQRVAGLLHTLVAEDAAAAGVKDDLGRHYWSRRVFACDTEATDIDVSTQCAAGHGRVTCFSVYGGPDLDFAADDDLQPVPGRTPACVLYVDTFLDGNDGDADHLREVLRIWEAFRPFLEREEYPKVWHNYGFDKHVLQRRGFGIPARAIAALPTGEPGAAYTPEQFTLKLGGFAGDTLHLARLHDAGRKGTQTYSLASLSGDPGVMAHLDAAGAARSKVSMKALFSVPKLTKAGKPSASLKELPAIHSIQTSEDPVTRWKWVDYSAFDAKATWDLYHSLRDRLRATHCAVDPPLAPGLTGRRDYTQWDLYLDTVRPFGAVLTEMEQAGFFVDGAHLAAQDGNAQADLRDAELRFRAWLRRHSAVIGAHAEEYGLHPDDIPELINLSSSAQIQTLLFGGFQAAKAVERKPLKAEAAKGAVAQMVKPSVDIVREFTAPNPDYGKVKGAKRNITFPVQCVFGAGGTKIKSKDVSMVTAVAGLPMTSAAALRALCGKQAAAKKALLEVDATNVHAQRAAVAEALGDGVADGGDESAADDAAAAAGSEDESAAAMCRHPVAVKPAPPKKWTKAQRKKFAAESGVGLLYLACDDHAAGLEACAAVEALIEISAIETLRSSFLLPLQGDAVKAEDGRVHCSLNINTETGRLSCRRPNLQNQPALEKDRYFIRKAFRAEAGRTLAVADYGQLELRILAHLTDCSSMIAAFESGGDFHSRTAAGMFDFIQARLDAGTLAVDHMDPNFREGMPLVKDEFGSERRKAKILNFSLAYGKTEFGLAKDFGVELDEAKEIVARWYSSRPEVRAWQERVREQARADTGQHRVHTMLGRHRALPGYAPGKSKREVARASRAAINTPVQGSAADVVAAAMVRVHEDPKLRELGWRMLLQVHDEVIMEGAQEHAAEAQARLVRCMQEPFVRDRAQLHRLMKERAAWREPLSEEQIAAWDACYHCGMRLALTVDSDVADTWYDAK